MSTDTPTQPNLDLTTLTWIMADLEDQLTTLRAAREMAQVQGQWEDALRFSHETVALGKWAQHIIRTYSGKDHTELMEGEQKQCKCQRCDAVLMGNESRGTICNECLSSIVPHD